MAQVGGSPERWAEWDVTRSELKALREKAKKDAAEQAAESARKLAEAKAKMMGRDPE
jgi:hypothetical protein